MAEQNPTVIIAHLDDEKLRKSIDSLVGYVDEKFKAMTTSTTNAVNTMQNELQKLGSLNAKGVGGSGGGELGITKALQRAKQEAKESSITFDQMTASMQKATTGNGNKTIFSTMDTEISILKERLVEAKSQVESFTVMARRGAETGDKGLFTFSTENLHKYEAEVEKLTQQINSLTSQRQALKEMLNPQGDAFKNYVDSLTKANPELAALNAQYKEGKSLLQQQTIEVKRKNQEEQEGIRSAKERAAAQERYSQQLREASAQEKASQKERAVAAMETAKALRDAMKAQKDDNIANNTQQSIAGVRELHDVINQMHRTYLKMSEEEKASPIGKSLQQDILLSRQALQEYEKYNRALLGMASRDPIANRDKVDSYTMLSNRVRQLTKEYQSMTTAERDSAKGKGVAEKIQLFSRALSEIQKQMNRPTSLKNALGLDENTLDRIAYKIQQLNTYRAGLNITDKKQVGEMRTVETEIDRLKKKQDELMGKNQQLMSSNNALARSWNYMKNRLAFYFTVGASTQFVKNLIEVRSQYEMNERALGVLIDSAERGTQIFNELSQMALVSPYTLIELSSAAKQLTAYDVAAKDVVDTTRRLADMASAVGIPMERLTYALGQIKAYGYLNSRDARMFLNAGIPLVKSLAEHYTELEGHMVSVGDVYDRIKKKAVGYNDVMTVITEMTDEGGRFFDFQAKMADTLKVQLANLTLAWNNMLNDIGESQQGFLVGGIKALKEFMLHWHDIERAITNVAVVIGIARASQLAFNLILGKGVATMDAMILANKKRMATELQQKALTQTLTAPEQQLLATKNKITAADYQQMLSGANLTKQRALMLVAFRKNNKELMQALVNMKVLTQAEIQNMTVAKGMKLAVEGLKVSFEGLLASLAAIAPMLLASVGIMAIVDGMQYINEQQEKTVELNKNIAQNAKEASDALSKFISQNKKSIGNLSKDDAQKNWDALREQIELSSIANSFFIQQLLQEEDINQRLVKGFNLAERIEQATNAMAGLEEESLKVSQDSWLWGAFGEGLATDLEDYIKDVNHIRELFGGNTEAKGTSKDEALRELRRFADDAEEVLRERLGDSGVADPVQLKEALERIKKEVKAANPKIRGEVERFFDVEVDKLMAQRFQGVYDKTYSLQQMFINHIKRDSGAALQNMSDDILDTSKQLDDDIIEAIEKAWKKIESELPAQEKALIAELQKNMDANPLLLRVMLQEAGNVEIRDEIQKDFDRHFGLEYADKPLRPKKPLQAEFLVEGSSWMVDFDAYNKAVEKYNREMEDYTYKMSKYNEETAKQAKVYAEFNKKEGEDRVKWGKRILDAEKEANEQAKAAAHTQQQVKAELGEQAALTDERYKAAVKDEEAAVKRANAARKAYNYEHLYNEEKTKGSSGTKKDEFGDALAKEVQYISDIQKRFNEYQKMGVDAQHALTLATDEYGKSIIRNNAILQKYGVKTLSSEQLATMPLQEVRDFYQEQLKGANLSAKGVEALEKAIANLNVEITKVDYKRITDGLNNELSKIKDEYELAVELDANPEMGNLFADWMGIDTNELPRTFQEVVRKAQQGIDKVFAENNRTDKIDIASMLNKESFDKWVKDSGLAIDSELVKAVEQFRQYLHKTQVDENKKITDGWSNLITKYGDLQSKILKIYKESVQEQINIIRKFGDSGEVKEALDLSKQISLSDDPAVVAELQQQLANILKGVTDRNPQAFKFGTAVENKTKSDTSKAYWEDFKNSELYTMTFEDMANNSTQAIQMIIDKLNELKDKVKEDPASMKALIKSLEDAEDELMSRDPFAGIANSIKDWTNATKEQKDAQEELKQANIEVAGSETALKNAQSVGDKEAIAKAEQKLAQAQQKQATAQAKVVQSGNKAKKAQEQLKNSLQNLSNELGNVSGLLGSVSQIFRAVGDDDTADAIDAINQGFTIMTTVISAVTAALVILKSSNPWLLAMAAALGVIVGLVSFLSGNSNKKITKQVEESERHVKALEISYQDLQDAMEDAYGYGEVAAKRATITNKELQLVELQRQLQLEKSRKKKNQDANRIMELQSAIINLRNELDGSTKDIVNDLLGISSVGDAAEQLVSSMIDAFKNGKDYMKVYEDSFEDMIDNLIMKAIVGEIVGRKVQQMFDAVEKESTKRADKTAYSAKMPSTRDMLEELYPDYGITEKNIRDYNNIYFNRIREAKTFEEVLSAYEKSQADALQRGEQNFYDMLQKQKEFVLSEYADAATIRPEDLRVLTPEWKESWMDGVQDLFTGTMDTLGITFGQGAEKSLSNLQQGISSITEETAGAIESYLNGMSQQVYYQSDILTQIRDTVQGFDLDVSLGVQSQMLLQLQNSYQTQQAIQQILEGVLVPSGRAFAVELLS